MKRPSNITSCSCGNALLDYPLQCCVCYIELCMPCSMIGEVALCTICRYDQPTLNCSHCLQVYEFVNEVECECCKTFCSQECATELHTPCHKCVEFRCKTVYRAMCPQCSKMYCSTHMISHTCDENCCMVPYCNHSSRRGRIKDVCNDHSRNNIADWPCRCCKQRYSLLLKPNGYIRFSRVKIDHNELIVERIQVCNECFPILRASIECLMLKKIPAIIIEVLIKQILK